MRYIQTKIVINLKICSLSSHRTILKFKNRFSNYLTENLTGMEKENSSVYSADPKKAGEKSAKGLIFNNR